MDLNTLWFIIGARGLLLPGVDYGVGILLPFLGKEDGCRALVRIGPF